MIELLMLATAPLSPLPEDVHSFLVLRGHCEANRGTDSGARKHWECDRIPGDRKRLIARYRLQPRIVDAVKGPWVIVTQRVPIEPSR